MTSAVDLDFRPEVPAFDANAALGRRHDRRVAVDDAAGLLAEMDRAGVERALVYAPHAAAFDSAEGNAGLLEAIGDETRLVPQFVCNPTFDDLDATAAQIEAADVRAVRMVPTLHHYPFRSWVVGEWLEWLSSRGIPLWLPASYEANWHDGGDLDPHAVHETAREFPDLTVVLCEVHYVQASWAPPLLRSLPNLSIEVSRYVIVDGIARLLEIVGPGRVLFGSRFPEQAIAPQLYHLHRLGLNEADLRAVCGGNLERLLGMSTDG